jgi:hypothetical protein
LSQTLPDQLIEQTAPLSAMTIEVAQSTVSIYMVPRPDRPLQTWNTFSLQSHGGDCGNRSLCGPDDYVSATVRISRSPVRTATADVICGDPQPDCGVLARQITEAFPWGNAPKYLIRHNDRAFGAVFKTRVRAMGIRDRPTSLLALAERTC